VKGIKANGDAGLPLFGSLTHSRALPSWVLLTLEVDTSREPHRRTSQGDF
jgi:hypothetical protein